MINKIALTNGVKTMEDNNLLEWVNLDGSNVVQQKIIQPDEDYGQEFKPAYFSYEIILRSNGIIIGPNSEVLIKGPWNSMLKKTKESYIVSLGIDMNHHFPNLQLRTKWENEIKKLELAIENTTSAPFELFRYRDFIIAEVNEKEYVFVDYFSSDYPFKTEPSKPDFPMELDNTKLQISEDKPENNPSNWFSLNPKNSTIVEVNPVYYSEPFVNKGFIR